MATAKSEAKSDETKSGSGEFTCPECGKTFSRAQALGAHRSRAHGIAGTSKSARGQKATSGGRSRSGASAQTSSAGAASNGRRTGRSSSTRRSAARSGGNGGGNSLDRNALLRSVFPNGIPAREDVIAAANSWLDEAERLAAAR